MSGSTITSVPRQPDQPRARSDQQSAVVATEPRSTTAPCVDGELMPQRQVLEDEISAGADRCEECCDKQTEVEHRRASRGSPILCYLSIEPHGSSFAVPRVKSLEPSTQDRRGSARMHESAFIGERYDCSKMPRDDRSVMLLLPRRGQDRTRPSAFEASRRRKIELKGIGCGSPPRVELGPWARSAWRSCLPRVGGEIARAVDSGPAGYRGTRVDLISKGLPGTVRPRRSMIRLHQLRFSKVS